MLSRLHMDSTAARGIIDRQGLSKVRHLDVNLPWLQEQLARDKVPLVKIPGPENNADLMTKHLQEGMIRKHVARMCLEFQDGRSNKAANLQSVAKISRRERKDKAEDKLNSICSSFANDSGGDYWHARGERGTWIRVHATARRALFTPAKVSKGPNDLDKLQCRRTTIGIDKSGRTFTITDDWRDSQIAHRLLDDLWTGKTIFYVRSCTWSDEI